MYEEMEECCDKAENVDREVLDIDSDKFDIDVWKVFTREELMRKKERAEKERIEKDPLGNIPEPGDTVILLEGGADIFVGFNKASWSCLKGHGYGYVIKKHPVNTNGGEPLKTPEDFNVSA